MPGGCQGNPRRGEWNPARGRSDQLETVFCDRVSWAAEVGGSLRAPEAPFTEGGRGHIPPSPQNLVMDERTV